MTLSATWQNAFRSISALLLTFCFLPGLRAQELLCDISMRTENVQSVEPRVLNEMKKAIRDFMNQRRWTNDDFKPEERIRCTIALTLGGTVGNYTATAQIIASRPVYGTTYETRLLNFVDKDWAFQYTEGQPLDFQPGTFTNNLTSLLAYYAYIILGLDYDTFSKLGGKNHFQLAQQIGQNALQGGLKGWNQFDGTNTRYFLLENIMSQQMTAFRESWYEYHRKGLDVFTEKPDEARKFLLDALKKLKVAFDQRPTSIYIKIVLDMKSNEFIKIMKESTQPAEKKEVYDLLIVMDPPNTDAYGEIMK